MIGMNWWTGFWPRLPVLLALLAGTVLAFVAFLQRRRRTASFLGAVGFALLLVLNLLDLLLPLVWKRVSLGLVVGLHFYLNLFTVVAIILLIVAVVLEERRARKGKEAAE